MISLKRIIFICCLLFASTANSTCIVILRYGNKIFVVSDTKSTLFYSDSRYKIDSSIIIDKVHNVGSFYFAVAGHYDQRLTQVARISIVPGKSLEDVARTFAVNMKTVYESLMAQEKITNRESYNYSLKNDLAGVTFFSSEGDLAKLIEIRFTMQDGPKPIINAVVKYDLPFSVLGYFDHIFSRIEQMTDKDWQQFKQDPLLGIEKWVKLELKNHPKAVGCPLDYLLLANGKGTRKRKVCK
jgi:hypothetical protein